MAQWGQKAHGFKDLDFLTVLGIAAVVFALIGGRETSQSERSSNWPGPRYSVSGLRFSRAPLWINGILLARRFSCLFSGSWTREAKPSPDSAFTQGGCFNARSTHY